MEQLKKDNVRNPFVEISKEIPPYTERQICNRWRNYLNPECE